MLASSSEVYGDPLVHPQTEHYRGNVNPIGVRGVYDEAKRYAESITFAYHRHHKVDTRIVRIFNTYGPRMRQDDGRMVPTFVSQALAGQPLTIYGDGSQTRSIQYVDDLDLAAQELYYQLGDLPHRVLLLVASGTDLPPEHGPAMPGEQLRSCVDPALAGRVLGWRPEADLASGLKKTLRFFGAL